MCYFSSDSMAQEPKIVKYQSSISSRKSSHVPQIVAFFGEKGGIIDPRTLEMGGKSLPRKTDSMVVGHLSFAFSGILPGRYRSSKGHLREKIRHNSRLKR